jgi:hypothetical protein
MALSALRPSLVMVVLLLALSGCSKNSPPLVPVSGKVQSDGKGVPGVVVQFTPDSTKNPKGFTAQASTGADGSFTLKTPPYGDGASPGWYRVTVAGYGNRQPFSSKYTRFDKSPLVVEIPQGGKSDVVLKVD